MDKAKLDPLLIEMAGIFNSAGKEAFLVGGAVRDMLLHSPSHDWDLATDALPHEVQRLFGSRRIPVIPTGIKHGTVTVLFKGHSVEVTTFRTESDYSDGRRPAHVNFNATIEQDLSRRDLTMNAIALELPGGAIVDPFNGRLDIKRKLIRCVGDPAARFSEDGLRPLRALRFAAQLDFALEDATLAAIPGAIATTAKVSAERIRDELDKMLTSRHPSHAFIPMENTGLLKLLLPELAQCRGVTQKGFHHFDVLDHSLLACDYAAKLNTALEVRMAALLHDIGKPPCRKLSADGVYTFYRHEEASAQMADSILRRYRYHNAFREDVVHLVREHMFHYTEDWSDAAVRRFIIRTGEGYLQRLYQLRLCDTYGMAALEPDPRELAPLQKRVEKVLSSQKALSLRDLAVKGADLIAAGILPGKRMGVILKQLLEAVLEDPALNERDKLLAIARNYYQA
jgi:putative nucleotidyltransferase with HDIG domain